MRFEAKEEIIANKKLKLYFPKEGIQACFLEWKEHWKVVFTPNECTLKEAIILKSHNVNTLPFNNEHLILFEQTS